MNEDTSKTMALKKIDARWIFLLLVVIGAGTFLFGLSSQHPERAWQAYLINFLLFSAIAQGAVLFSAVMHMTNARWSGPLSGLSESFAAFFPISFILFLVLFLGKSHIFPWLHEDLHGKEVWLNIPFLFTRDCIGLLILYIIGFLYLFNALQFKLDPNQSGGVLRKSIIKAWQRNHQNPEKIKRQMTVWGGLYIFAFALVLCLIGFDLVMSMDPHWISTLFGAYHFVKAFFIGLGALIILAAIMRIRQGEASSLKANHFHDIGKLFFGFCLLWADFFFVQLLVIYYGNIPEETHYVIVRTMLAPWNKLAWTVLIVCFIGPFFILLRQSNKKNPLVMLIICSAVIIGIWLEHLLLLGPALSHEASTIPLGISDGFITLGFLGLMAIAIGYFLSVFPETIPVKESNGA
jgi:hypothetical protein